MTIGAYEWNNIKDRMPGEGQQCIIRQHNCAYFTVSILERDEDGYKWSDLFNVGDNKKHPVTHWALINEKGPWDETE